MSKRILEKRIRSFVVENISFHLVNLDLGNQNLNFLEFKQDIERKVKIPDFLGELVDVSEDPQFFTFNLASLN